MEAASKNAKDLCARITSATVNAVKQGNQSKSPKGKCFSCGANHLRQSCKYRDAECHKCHKKGHISRVCGMFDLHLLQISIVTEQIKGGRARILQKLIVLNSIHPRVPVLLQILPLTKILLLREHDKSRTQVILYSSSTPGPKAP